MSASTIKHLRAKQAARVMGKIGPLLDSWEQLPNDVISDPQLRDFRERIENLVRAIEGESE